MYLRDALERAVYHVQHQEQEEDEEFEEDMEETDDFQMTFEYEKQDHRLVIDETAAEIVRYIFKLRLEGKAAVRISRI